MAPLPCASRKPLLCTGKRMVRACQSLLSEVVELALVSYITYALAHNRPKNEKSNMAIHGGNAWHWFSGMVMTGHLVKRVK